MRICKLSACVRPGDLVERLTKATAGRFVHDTCVLDYPGASVGVALSQPGESNAAALVQRADAAMRRCTRSSARKAQR